MFNLQFNFSLPRKRSLHLSKWNRQKFARYFLLIAVEGLLIASTVLFFVFAGTFNFKSADEDTTADTKGLVIIAAVSMLVWALFLLIFFRLYGLLMIQNTAFFLALIFFVFNHSVFPAAPQTSSNFEYSGTTVIHLVALVFWGTLIQLMLYKKIKTFVRFRASLWLYFKKHFRIFLQAMSNYFLVYLAPLGLLLFVSFFKFVMSWNGINMFDKTYDFTETMIMVSFTTLVALIVQVVVFSAFLFLLAYFFSPETKKHLNDWHLFVKKEEHYCFIAKHHGNVFLKTIKNAGRQTFLSLFVLVALFAFVLTVPATIKFLKDIDFFSENIVTSNLETNSVLSTETATSMLPEKTLNVLAFLFGWIFVSLYFLVAYRRVGFVFFLQNMFFKLIFFFLFVAVINLFEQNAVDQVFPFLVLVLIYDLMFVNFLLMIGTLPTSEKIHSESLRYYKFFSKKRFSPRSCLFILLLLGSLIAFFLTFGFDSPFFLMLVIFKFCTLIFYYNIKQVWIYLKLNQLDHRLSRKLENVYKQMPDETIDSDAPKNE